MKQTIISNRWVGPGGGGYSIKFYTGSPVPFTWIYHFFLKWYLFHIPFTDKWYPFHIPSLDLCSPFNCWKCNILKIWINHKSRTFSRILHSHEIPYTWRLKKVPLSGGAPPTPRRGLANRSFFEFPQSSVSKQGKVPSYWYENEF